MEKIINLSDRRPGDKPDPEHVDHAFRTDHVDTTYRFTCSYEFDGTSWGLEIWARDLPEAERKFKAIAGGRVDGQVFATVPA